MDQRLNLCINLFNLKKLLRNIDLYYSLHFVPKPVVDTAMNMLSRLCADYDVVYLRISVLMGNANNALAEMLNEKMKENDDLKAALKSMGSELDAIRGQMNGVRATMTDQECQMKNMRAFNERFIEKLHEKSIKRKQEKAKQEETANQEQNELKTQIAALKLQRDELEKTVKEQRREMQSTSTAKEEELGQLRNTLRVQTHSFQEKVKHQKDREATLRSALKQLTDGLKHPETAKQTLANAGKKELIAEVALLNIQFNQLEHAFHQKNAQRRSVQNGLKKLESSLIARKNKKQEKNEKERRHTF